MITQSFELNLIPGGVKPIVKASQYDKESRMLQIVLFAGAVAFPVPDGAEVLIQGTKKDNTGFQYECTAAGNVVTATIEQQMTVFPGDVEIELQILASGQTLGTGNFILQVEEAALKDDTIISETEIPIIQHIPEYVSEAAGYAHDAEESAQEAAAAAKNLWYPTVDTNGDISWQKSTSETAPTTRNIKGPTGQTGPTGPTGATGNGIASVVKTGSFGLVDTYRINFTDGTYFDYTVTNGSGSSVTWTQTQATGTKIAEIDINGVSQNVYVPDSGPTYTEGDGIDITNNTISVDTTFTEASTRTNIASGDSFSTILGKIKKFFTDLKAVAFSGAAADVTYDSGSVKDALDDLIRGSVSVTADGVKTYGQLLNELYALVDYDKIGIHSVVDWYDGSDDSLFQVVVINPAYIYASFFILLAGGQSAQYSMQFGNANSYMFRLRDAATRDYSSETPVSGIVLTLYY